MRVLGIETSCDETAVAVYDGEQGLLSHVLHSQIALHAPYGGVVPELASRDHIQKTLPLVEAALNAADLSLHQIEGIAYTAGPGLIGALMVGASLGRSLGWALGVPTIGVHHMEAHLLAPLLETNPPEFPFMGLLVSGGHTLLVEVSALGAYEILGETLDDAVGEAFDKTAKVMGLGYPGGAALAALALKGQKDKFHFPRPMVDRPGLDFSFSGLKTHVRNVLNASPGDPQTLADIAFAFEEAIVETLLIKSKRALTERGLQRLVVAGGVGANKKLRSRIQEMMHERGGQAFFPRPEFCTDNAAQTAFAGYHRLMAGQRDGLEIQVHSRWPMDTLKK